MSSSTQQKGKKDNKAPEVSASDEYKVRESYHGPPRKQTPLSDVQSFHQQISGVIAVLTALKTSIEDEFEANSRDPSHSKQVLSKHEKIIATALSNIHEASNLMEEEVKKCSEVHYSWEVGANGKSLPSPRQRISKIEKPRSYKLRVQYNFVIWLDECYTPSLEGTSEVQRQYGQVVEESVKHNQEMIKRWLAGIIRRHHLRLASADIYDVKDLASRLSITAKEDVMSEWNQGAASARQSLAERLIGVKTRQSGLYGDDFEGLWDW